MITAACLQCFFMHDVTDIFVFTKNFARKFSKSPSSMIMQYIDASCLNNKIIMMMFQFIVNFQCQHPQLQLITLMPASWILNIIIKDAM